MTDKKDMKSLMSDIIKASKSVHHKGAEVSIETSVVKTAFDEMGNQVKAEDVVTESSTNESKIYPMKPSGYVNFELAGNVNLGNYNSGRVKVGITIPVGKETDQSFGEELNKTFLYAKSFVEGKIGEELKKLSKMASR